MEGRGGDQGGRWQAVAILVIGLATTILLLTPSPALAGANELPEGLYPVLLKTLQEDLHQSYHITRQVQPEVLSRSSLEGTHQALNRAQKLRATFTPEGIRLIPHSAAMQDLGQAVGPSWTWGLSLAGYGYRGHSQPVPAAEWIPAGNRIESYRGNLIEWYMNEAQGVEQGFTLVTPPVARAPGLAPLEIELALSGNLLPHLTEGDQAIVFTTLDSKTVLHYSKLYVYDKIGRSLPAHLELSSSRGTGAGIRIVVDDTGAVYPITVDPIIFTETELNATDPAAADRFGFSVAISGTTAVVGATHNDDACVANPGCNSGSVYVFVQAGAGVWNFQQKLTASDAILGDQFGFSVAISGDTLVVGAPQPEVFGNGAAYVFVRSGVTWTEQQKLTASDAAAGDQFGHSVSISGDTVVVGARFNDDAGNASGSAYVFVRSGVTWTEQQKLTASDAAANDDFGTSVSINVDT
ncbi:MAG: FG-GAP repeat protein, partial [Nitrospira sp.]|nr:FG-GAP repeat protein [Nitrospira sp.]